MQWMPPTDFTCLWSSDSMIFDTRKLLASTKINEKKKCYKNPFDGLKITDYTRMPMST